MRYMGWITMNETDRKILNELKKDGRATNIRIAERLRISEGTVRNRIARMQEEGTIKRFTVLMGAAKGFSAFVHIKAKPNIKTDAIIESLRKISPHEAIYETSGDWDMIMKLDCASAEEFNERIDKIRSIQGVIETKSLIILKVN